MDRALRGELIGPAVALGLALLAGLSTLYYSTRVEPYRFRLRRRSVPLPGLPPALTGLRILHLSDFHITRTDWRRLKAILSFAAVDTDLIAMTGDFVDADDDAEARLAAEVIGRFRAPLGKFAVLGNHDRFRLGRHRALSVFRTVRFSLTGVEDRDPDLISTEGLPHIGRLLAASDTRLLVNEACPLTFNGTRFWIIGVDDNHLGFDDLERALAGVPADEFRVLLAHSPTVLPAAERAGIPLVLAGHTHGGQIRLPIVGAVAVGARRPAGDAGGLLPTRTGYIHISPGLGSSRSLPFRLGCPPEATLLELVPAQARPGPPGRPGSGGKT